MVMTPVCFEPELSQSIGMSGERHQMVCELWMEIVRVLSFQTHKKKVKCVYIILLNCQKDSELFIWLAVGLSCWLRFTVKDTRKHHNKS